jgi:hypothetical protein
LSLKFTTSLLAVYRIQYRARGDFQIEEVSGELYRPFSNRRAEIETFARKHGLNAETASGTTAKDPDLHRNSFRPENSYGGDHALFHRGQSFAPLGHYANFRFRPGLQKPPQSWRRLLSAIQRTFPGWIIACLTGNKAGTGNRSGPFFV